MANSKVSPQDEEEGGGGEGCCGEMNDARKQSGLTCSFLVFTTLNVAMLVVGVNATGHCPEEPMVPTYLIVAGSTSLSLLLVRLLISHLLLPYLESKQRASTERGDGEDDSAGGTLATLVLTFMSIYDSIASIFSTVWLIVGSVYVYGASPQYDHSSASDYCEEGAYMFAFIVITIGYVSLFLSLLAACCHVLIRKRNQ